MTFMLVNLVIHPIDSLSIIWSPATLIAVEMSIVYDTHKRVSLMITSSQYCQ